MKVTTCYTGTEALQHQVAVTVMRTSLGRGRQEREEGTQKLKGLDYSKIYYVEFVDDQIAMIISLLKIS